MVKIRYLDGFRFRRAVLAGVDWLHRKRDFLNSINVYPVADADTGTNMSLTMQSAAEGLRQAKGRAIGQTAEEMAQCAILGSQGNSGAILAQFFQGLADSLKGKLRITIRDFAMAVERAKLAAYAALSQPREGTILTVIKDWSDFIVTHQGESEDFVVLLRQALERAKVSLKETPNQLEVLRRHGVVDAGAQGFIHLLEGITEYVEAGHIRLRKDAEPHQALEPLHFAYGESPEDLRYRYCTECIVEAAGVERAPLEERLAPLGDSVVVVAGGNLLKVHLHTNEPQALFDLLRGYGPILREKAQDMQAQHDEAVADAASVAIVTDSSCDLPPEYLRRNHVVVVPLKILFGDRVFLDKVTLGPADFLLESRLSPHHPKTSQPAVSDYLRAYEEAAKRGKEIVVISLAAALSGTMEAAKTAAAQFRGVPIHVVDGRSVAVGQGLLVQEARSMALAGLPARAIVEKIESLRSNLRLFIFLKSLEFARKGGRVSAVQSVAATLLNLKPVLSIDREGKAVKVGVGFGVRGARRKVFRLARAAWEKSRSYRVAVTHVSAPEAAEEYRRLLEKATGKKDVLVIEAAAVLAAHAGPGAVAIAVLGLD